MLWWSRPAPGSTVSRRRRHDAARTRLVPRVEPDCRSGPTRPRGPGVGAPRPRRPQGEAGRLRRRRPWTTVRLQRALAPTARPSRPLTWSPPSLSAGRRPRWPRCWRRWLSWVLASRLPEGTGRRDGGRARHSPTRAAPTPRGAPSPGMSSTGAWSGLWSPACWPCSPPQGVRRARVALAGPGGYRRRRRLAGGRPPPVLASPPPGWRSSPPCCSCGPRCSVGSPARVLAS